MSLLWRNPRLLKPTARVFCVVETHSQHFIRAPAGAWRTAGRCSAKAFRENSCIQLQWRLWLVIDHVLWDWALPDLTASLATQLVSRRSLVPEKRQSTRVSLSTLGHASPDSWQLLFIPGFSRLPCLWRLRLQHHCQQTDPFTSAHIVCTLGKFIPANLATVFGPMEQQKRNEAEQLPRSDLRVAIPCTLGTVSLTKGQTETEPQSSAEKSWTRFHHWHSVEEHVIKIDLVQLLPTCTGDLSNWCNSAPWCNRPDVSLVIKT